MEFNGLLQKIYLLLDVRFNGEKYNKNKTECDTRQMEFELRLDRPVALGPVQDDRFALSVYCGVPETCAALIYRATGSTFEQTIDMIIEKIIKDEREPNETG